VCWLCTVCRCITRLTCHELDNLGPPPLLVILSYMACPLSQTPVITQILLFNPQHGLVWPSDMLAGQCFTGQSTLGLVLNGRG
jgi:hypothetical protein